MQLAVNILPMSFLQVSGKFRPISVSSIAESSPNFLQQRIRLIQFNRYAISRSVHILIRPVLAFKSYRYSWLDCSR